MIKGSRLSLLNFVGPRLLGNCDSRVFGNARREAPAVKILRTREIPNTAGSFSVICSIFCALLVLGSTSLLWAQTNTATLHGTVKDSTGAVVAGAQVTATNTDTNQSEVAKSGPDGAYRFESIPVGNYSIRTESAGFKETVNSGLTLTVAQQAVLDITLEVGTVAQQVQVTAVAQQVDTSTSTLGSTVNEQQVANLPLNGRNYAQLALLQSGINEQKNRVQTASANLASQGTFYSSNGAPTRSNAYLVDGTSMAEYGGATASSISGSTLGIDGIREFKILSNNFDAQYGMVMGSQMLVVSKGGTNSFHGDVFEFLRNSALDARNYFDTPASAGFTAAGVQRRLPPFRRSNYGASGGGPIKKDKTFFYGVYEAIRQIQGLTELNNTIPSGCRGQAGATITPAQCSYLTSNVTVSPVTAPWLSASPLGNLAPIFPLPNFGTSEVSWSYGSVTTEDYGQMRIDQTFSAKDTLFDRYTVDNAVVSLPGSQPGFPTSPTSREQLNTLSETHIVSPNLLNTATFGYSRSNLLVGGPTYYNGPGYSFIPSGPANESGPNGFEMGILTVSGNPSVTSTPGGVTVSQGKQSIFSYADDVYYTRGKHSLKYGALINRYQLEVQNGLQTSGTITFLNMQNFLQAQANSINYFTPGFDDRKDIRFWTLGFYIQDNYKLSSKFTLNLGFRYEPNTNMIVLKGKGASIANPWVDAQPTTGNLMMEDPSWHNFSPRFGFAWDPLGNGKTAVRGGFGYLQNVATWIGFVHSTTKQLPEENAITLNAPTTAGIPFTIPLTTNVTLPLTSRSPTFYHYYANGQQPRGVQYNVSIQQQLPFAMALTLAYTGSRNYGLLTITQGNPTFPQGIPGVDASGNETCVARPAATLPINLAQQVYTDGKANTCWVGTESWINQNWGQMTYLQGSGQSWYNSGQATLNKIISHGLQFQTALTWSRLFDTTQSQSASDTGTASSGTQLDPLHPERDRGPATFDLPITFRMNAIYNLPGVDHNGFVGVLANGWRLLPIYQAQSGSAFDLGMGQGRSLPLAVAGTASADRPDIYPGRTYHSVTHGVTAGCAGIAAGQKLGTPQLFYDPCAFHPAPRGFYGDMARNSLRGPDFQTLDLSLVKETRAPWMGEAGQVEFRVEGFNILNRANFGTPNRTVYPGSGPAVNDINETVTANAGKITQTLSTSRQIQLAVKLVF